MFQLNNYLRDQRPYTLVLYILDRIFKSFTILIKNNNNNKFKCNNNKKLKCNKNNKFKYQILKIINQRNIIKNYNSNKMFTNNIKM